ncbi:MAG: hypothetical protein L0216_04800 [Planctomycetales bacterium]|nr:hypothetical protein [Planctomycetales bacterium]
MWRGLLGTLAGTVAAMLLITLVQQVSHRVYPMPPGVTPQKKEEFAAWVKTLPLGALLFVLASYILGSFGGGLVAALVGAALWPALVVGGLLMAMGIMILFEIPHPPWFAVVTLLVYVPLAWLGGWIVL